MGRVATKFVNRNRLQAKTHFFKAFPDSIKKFKNPASTVPIEQSHQQIVYYLQDYFPFFNFPGPSRILKNLFASLLQSSMSMKIFFYPIWYFLHSLSAVEKKLLLFLKNRSTQFN